jgi:hypothetical protein
MEQAEQADLGNIKVLSIVQIASWQLHELIKYEETKPSVRACVPHTRQLKPLTHCFLLKTRCGNPM